MMQFRLALAVAMLVSLAAGCGPRAAEPAPPAAAGMAEDDDHHHGPGPHGGTVADWGGGAYHVEFVVDHDRQEATVYVLGDDAQTPAPIRADKLLLSINQPLFDVELAAQPLEGETSGASSRFVGGHPQLGVEQEFAGTITAEIDGTPYAGDFDESAAPHAH